MPRGVVGRSRAVLRGLPGILAALLGARAVAAQSPVDLHRRPGVMRIEGGDVHPGVEIALAALVPGAGQAVGGRYWTAALFAAVEGAAWWVHLDARGDRDRFRRAYRDLAWDVARDRPEPRLEGGFDYYERMIHWTRSGAWDADPGTPGVQPERAPDSWNGRQWRLAADIFLEGALDAAPGDPGYASALAYYLERAYEPPFEWDWSGREAEQDRYAGLIDRTDDASRRASIALGAVVANHVLSAVEAFVVGRLDARRVDLDVSPGGVGGVGAPVAATFRVRILLP